MQENLPQVEVEEEKKDRRSRSQSQNDRAKLDQGVGQRFIIALNDLRD